MFKPHGARLSACAEMHLHRYLAEFDFRYNNHTKLGVSDVERRDHALKGKAAYALGLGRASALGFFGFGRFWSL